jgi:formylglycine-generating enzyme required for sulfatase activity
VEELNYQTTSEKWIAEHGRSPQQPMWNDPALFPARDNMPVCAVSWQDAVDFCKWLSDREGVSYRLPSEAEWEYACRAGTTGPWSCQEADLSAFAVTSRPWREGPSPIGQRRPNPWGLYDMHGNAWEWCQDYYSTTFYSTAPSTDPVCSEPVEGTQRVMRGGGYFAGSRAIRSAMRRGRDNSEAYSDGGHSISFRVVCDKSAPRLARSR